MEAIPAELRERPQWVVWRYVRRGSKWTKEPHRARDPRRKADTTDPATWGTFDEAVAAYRNRRNDLDGIGFVFAPDDGLAGADFDHCLGPDGEVAGWADAYLKRFPTYAEISPSGEGVKVFCRGELDPKGRKKKVGLGPQSAGAIEVYDRARFFTVTGNSFGDVAGLADCTEALKALQSELATLGKKVKGWVVTAEGPSDLADDDALLEKARRAKNGAEFSALFDQGDTGRHAGDDSAADFALCCKLAFWTGADAARIDRLFRRSGLMRDKWDERRGATTYGALTIANAISATAETYRGNGHMPGEDGKGGFVGFVGTSAEDSSKKIEFPETPRPLSVELLPVPPLDPKMIPGPFRQWLVDIASRGCFPLEYPAAAALVGCAALIGRRLAIRPKRHDDWLVVPNLWGAVVGPPGMQKTPPVEEALRPLRRLVADAFQRNEKEVRRHNEELTVKKAQAEAAAYKLKQAARKDASPERLAELATAAVKPDETPPKAKRYIVNDATIEKLGELLAENPHGLLQFRDELTGFFKTMDRQGHESDRGFYLESWNGLGSYVYDRISRGTVVIPNVCMSLFGTIQPGPLSRYLRGAAAGEDADGFMPRFQVLVYPDPSAEFVNVDRYPETEAKNRAYAIFQALEQMNPLERAGQFDEERKVAYLGFDSRAQEFFDQWRTDLENRLRSGADNTLVQCHLAKYRSLMPSLALVFHLVAAVQQSGKLPPVDLRAARMAAAWCDFLERHARRVYQSALDGDPEGAMHLAERIKQSLPNPFTFRQVAQKGWAGLGTVDDVRRAVGILEDRGWVRVVEERSGPGSEGGRTSEKVHIHPQLQGEAP